MSIDQGTVFFLVVLAAAAVAAAVVVLALWLSERRRDAARIQQLLLDRDRSLADARRESVEKSRSTLKGKMAEQLAPLLPGFRYLPADARFLGDPVDYIVFNGYTGVRDDAAGVDGLEIVLLEVKQGRSALSPFQRAIARSVEDGRVRFEICRVADDGTVASETWRPRRQGRPA
jgi:predicted Holliday junction resolvase-like endonuclease